VILGIDPGLATFGWAKLSDRAQVLELGVLLSPVKGKTKDHAGRTHRQATTLIDLLDGCSIVVAEALSFPRFHAGVASLALSWGVILGACTARGVPVVSVSPQKWQHAAAAQAGGSIQYDVLVKQLELHVRVHAAPRAVAALDAIPVTKRSHALDAVGVALYGAVRTCAPIGSSVVNRYASTTRNHMK